jgi:hypothetical protein
MDTFVAPVEKSGSLEIVGRIVIKNASHVTNKFTLISKLHLKRVQTLQMSINLIQWNYAKNVYNYEDIVNQGIENKLSI